MDERISAAAVGRVDVARLIEDAEFFAVTVEAQGTPWAIGCAKMLRTLAKALTEALVPAPSDWQSIETAKKDGTVVNVWLGDADESSVEFYCIPGTRFSSGWQWRDGKWRPAMGFQVPVFVQPTHWMPLPAAPQEQQE